MKKGDKLRVVIDTNLLISAVIAPKGLPNKLIRAWKDAKFDLITSPYLLKEMDEISLRDKFGGYHLFKEQMVELIEAIKASSEIIPSLLEEELSIHCRDPKDDKLLACATGANADYLVTGDQDLLVLNDNPALRKLKIIKAKEFLELI